MQNNQKIIVKLLRKSTGAKRTPKDNIKRYRHNSHNSFSLKMKNLIKRIMEKVIKKIIKKIMEKVMEKVMESRMTKDYPTMKRLP